MFGGTAAAEKMTAGGGGLFGATPAAAPGSRGRDLSPGGTTQGRMVRTMSGRREFDTRGSIQPGLSMEDQFRAMNREMQTECLPTPLPFDLEFDTPEAAIGRALSADLERVASSISNDDEAGLLS